VDNEISTANRLGDPLLCCDIYDCGFERFYMVRNADAFTNDHRFDQFGCQRSRHSLNGDLGMAS
jgi:hypothetical protein